MHFQFWIESIKIVTDHGQSLYALVDMKLWLGSDWVLKPWLKATFFFFLSKLGTSWEVVAYCSQGIACRCSHYYLNWIAQPFIPTTMN